MASDDKIFDLGTTRVTAPRLPVSYVGAGDLTTNPPVNIVLGFNSVMTDTPEYKDELGDFYPFKDLDNNSDSFVFNSQTTGFRDLSFGVGEGNKPLIELTIDDPGSEFLRRVLAFNTQESFKTQESQNLLAASGGANLQPIVSVGFGIGADARFWAGPFQTHLILAEHGLSDRGLEFVKLTLAPYDQLNSSEALYNIITSEGFPKAKDSYKLKLKSFSKVIGSVKKASSGRVVFTINPKGIIQGIYNLFTEEGGLFDILQVPNRIMLVPSELETPMNPLSVVNKPKSIPGMRVGLITTPPVSWYDVNPSDNINSVAQRIRSLGLDVIIPNIIDKEEADIKVEISESFTDAFNFYRFFKKFADGLDSLLTQNHNLVTKFETNRDIINIMKESENFGDLIVDDTKPVLILGNQSLINEMIYGYAPGPGATIKPNQFEADDEEYLMKIRRYLNQKQKQSNYYVALATGGRVDPDPDDVEPISTSSTETEIVFEANTPNANILSYKSLSDEISVWAFLSTPTATLEGFEKLFDYIQDKYAKEYLYPPANEGEKKPINYELYEKFAESKKPVFSISSDNLDEQRRLFALYQDILSKLSVTLEIETLPFFNLSDINLLGKTCIVNIYKNPDPNQRFRDDSESYLNKFYSGRYFIRSFEHNVGPKKASSKFTLQKDGVALEDRPFFQEYLRNTKG